MVDVQQKSCGGTVKAWRKDQATGNEIAQGGPGL